MTPSKIAEIREQVARTREALLSSADLTDQILALEAAVAQLQQLQASGVTKEELAVLRFEIQRVEALVDQGEAFWRNCSRWVGLDTGYTPGGVVAPWEAPPRVKVDG